jgi:alpha-L-rhamnosidase
VGEDGRIDGDTQAGYALALSFGLLDGKLRAEAVRRLVRDVESRGALSTGFLGTRELLPVLARERRADLAYRLFHRGAFPSWNFSIRHGATSVWERWDGWTPEKGFQDPGMNSFAHYSFGAVYQWMVESIGGIRSDGPAYKRIVLAPQPGGKLTWARTSYRSVRGPIETFWRTDEEDGSWLLDVAIPPGTSATLLLPVRDRAAVTEGGKPLERVEYRGRDRDMLKRVEGVQILRQAEESLTLEILSGRYSFRVSPGGTSM